MELKFDLYKRMLDNFHEGVYFVDKSREIMFWNKGAERITGYTAKEMVGRHCYDNLLNHVDDKGNQLCFGGCPLHKTIQDTRVREAGVFLQHKDGHRVEVSVRTMPMTDDDGEVFGAVEVFVDDAKQAQTNRTINELKTFAMYDQLTELPNRRYIDSFLTNRFSEFGEFGRTFAVIMGDIDNFKDFNDSYGHDVGDKVLQMVSKSLRSAFRKSDLVGRWGGEEFIAIVAGPSDEELEMMTERARNLVEQSILRSETEPINVTISIGASQVQKGDNASEIVKRADRAMYTSKENGRNQVTIL